MHVLWLYYLSEVLKGYTQDWAVDYHMSIHCNQIVVWKQSGGQENILIIKFSIRNVFAFAFWRKHRQEVYVINYYACIN